MKYTVIFAAWMIMSAAAWLDGNKDAFWAAFIVANIFMVAGLVVRDLKEIEKKDE